MLRRNDELTGQACLARETINIKGILNFSAQKIFAVASRIYPQWDDDYCRRLIKAFNLDMAKKYIKLSKGVVLFILLNFFYSLATLVSLLGVKYGWEYVLTAVFIILGTCFLSFRPVVLLFIFGWQLNRFLFLFLILTALFSLINYRYVVDFEYKY